jgi:hypothetical protein
VEGDDRVVDAMRQHGIPFQCTVLYCTVPPRPACERSSIDQSCVESAPVQYVCCTSAGSVCTESIPRLPLNSQERTGTTTAQHKRMPVPHHRTVLYYHKEQQRTNSLCLSFGRLTRNRYILHAGLHSATAASNVFVDSEGGPLGNCRAADNDESHHATTNGIHQYWPAGRPNAATRRTRMRRGGNGRWMARGIVTCRDAMQSDASKCAR